MRDYYKDFGGEPAVKQFAGELYAKVLKNKDLRIFFKKYLTSPTGIFDLQEKQELFLISILSNDPYCTEKMSTSHQDSRKLGLNSSHLNLFKEIFLEALKENNIDQEIINFLIKKIDFYVPYIINEP